jgi:hypothetical protein
MRETGLDADPDFVRSAYHMNVSRFGRLGTIDTTERYQG